MSTASATPDHDPLASALRDLTDEFTGISAPQAVADCLADSYQALLPARLHGHLPLLAHRFARERLRAAARPLLPDQARVPLVLFVCTGNSGRSVIAAALLERAGEGRVQVASAGTAPADQVQPEVLQVLREAGVVEAADAFPKPLTAEIVGNADIVVTMGCGDSCAVTPGRRYLDWDVADPAGQQVEAVRRIRDDIADRVAVLLTEITDFSQPDPQPTKESA
ncbi:MAG TPA: arsenate reductase ArsC [Nocardioidaceae bacterium]|nr:arsenate reductase ArsC [Nocardioidaceae bacterium]